MRFLSGLMLVVILSCAVVSSAQEQALRIKASDGDIYDITINTSDQALFQNAVGYVFDAAVYPLAGFRTNNDTLYVYKSGGGVSFKIYLGTSPTNGQTLVSNADKVLTFQTGGGGATAWSAIGDAAALGTIDFAGFDQDITSSEDGGDVLTITNTDADRVSSTNILVLADNDLADGEAAYLKMIGNAGVSPSTDYVFSQTAFTAFQAVDFSAASAFRIPVSSAPTVDNTGEVAFDTDIWGAGRGAQVAYDGTAATVLVGALVSDAPSNGQVPTWNTGGTITWEINPGDTVMIQIPAALFDTTKSGGPDLKESGLFRSFYWEFNGSVAETLIVRDDAAVDLPGYFSSFVRVEGQWEAEQTGTDSLRVHAQGFSHDAAHTVSSLSLTTKNFAILSSGTGPAANDWRSDAKDPTVTGSFSANQHMHIIVTRGSADTGVMRFYGIKLYFLRVK